MIRLSINLIYFLNKNHFSEGFRRFLAKKHFVTEKFAINIKGPFCTLSCALDAKLEIEILNGF